MGDRQDVKIARVLDPVLLQRSEVVGVTKCGAQLFEDRPVTLLALMPHFALKMLHQICHNPVIIEQGIVDVEEKNDSI